jgi:hypothetical protein
MNRRGWTCQVIDLIHFSEERLNYIVANEFEIWITNEMPNVVFTPRKQIIQAQDVVPLIQQVITEMASNEPCSTCN